MPKGVEPRCALRLSGREGGLRPLASDLSARGKNALRSSPTVAWRLDGPFHQPSGVSEARLCRIRAQSPRLPGLDHRLDHWPRPLASTPRRGSARFHLQPSPETYPGGAGAWTVYPPARRAPDCGTPAPSEKRPLATADLLSAAHGREARVIIKMHTS